MKIVRHGKTKNHYNWSSVVQHCKICDCQFIIRKGDDFLLFQPTKLFRGGQWIIACPECKYDVILKEPSNSSPDSSHSVEDNP